MINSVHAGSVGGAPQSPAATTVSKRTEANGPGEPASDFARFLADVLTRIETAGPNATDAGRQKPEVDPRSRGSASASDARVPVR